MCKRNVFKNRVNFLKVCLTEIQSVYYTYKFQKEANEYCTHTGLNCRLNVDDQSIRLTMADQLEEDQHIEKTKCFTTLATKRGCLLRNVCVCVVGATAHAGTEYAGKTTLNVE